MQSNLRDLVDLVFMGLILIFILFTVAYAGNLALEAVR